MLDTRIRLFFEWEDVDRCCQIRDEIPPGVELSDAFNHGAHWLAWEDSEGNWFAKKDEA
jgi:hypothetical protein